MRRKIRHKAGSIFAFVAVLRKTFLRVPELLRFFFFVQTFLLLLSTLMQRNVTAMTIM